MPVVLWLKFVHLHKVGHDDSPCANTLEDFGVWPTQQRKTVALCEAVISWRGSAPVAGRETSAQLRCVR